MFKNFCYNERRFKPRIGQVMQIMKTSFYCDLPHGIIPYNATLKHKDSLHIYKPRVSKIHFNINFSSARRFLQVFSTAVVRLEVLSYCSLTYSWGNHSTLYSLFLHVSISHYSPIYVTSLPIILSFFEIFQLNSEITKQKTGISQSI
jgi:hypothetical protein